MSLLSQDSSGIIIADGKITTQNQINERLLKEVKALKKSKEKLKKISKNKKGVTIVVQLLILKYLKFIDSIELKINDDKAQLLSCIINSNGTENIRKFLSNPQSSVSNRAQRKNLNYVINLFESLGLKDAVKLAKRDLLKLPDANSD